MEPILTDALALMQRRRSVAPVQLEGPGPSPSELETLLKLASRVPDHGKLAPWRFLVFQGEGAARAGAIALELKLEVQPDLDAAGRQAEAERFTRSPLVIGVVSRAAPHVKIPEWEQVLSAGASAMALEIAASALGFASTWLTEWIAYDARFAARVGLAPHERFAGFIHIGRPKSPPQDRPRPALQEIVTHF
jgi:nitroreductase